MAELSDAKIHPPVEVSITVNGKPVILVERKNSGVAIKEAAIKQHVAIELSFVLQEELPNGHSRIIGDTDFIEVFVIRSAFTAIPNDDNS